MTGRAMMVHDISDGDDADENDADDSDGDSGEDDGSDDGGGGGGGHDGNRNRQVFLGCSDLSTSVSLPHA